MRGSAIRARVGLSAPTPPPSHENIQPWERLAVSERHAFFLGESFQSNVAAIEREVGDNWLVRCGHCGVGLAGGTDGTGTPPVQIVWTHHADSWFGTFAIQVPTQAEPR
jgi:hypothetical protein